MDNYYVFFAEYDDSQYYFCVLIEDLSPSELEQFCDLVKKSNPFKKISCFFDNFGDDLTTLELDSIGYVVQKEREPYSLEEELKLEQIQTYSLDSPYAQDNNNFLQKIAKKIRNQRNNSDATPQKKSRRKNKSTQTDDIEDAMPLAYMAANTHKGGQIIPFNTYGEEVTIEPAEPVGVFLQNDDAKVLENAAYKGALRANHVFSGELTDIEKNILLYDNLGIGPTEIARRNARRNGASEKDIENEAGRIGKQINREKTKKAKTTTTKKKTTKKKTE